MVGRRTAVQPEVVGCCTARTATARLRPACSRIPSPPPADWRWLPWPPRMLTKRAKPRSRLNRLDSLQDPAAFASGSCESSGKAIDRRRSCTWLDRFGTRRTMSVRRVRGEEPSPDGSLSRASSDAISRSCARYPAAARSVPSRRQRDHRYERSRARMDSICT